MVDKKNISTKKNKPDSDTLKDYLKENLSKKLAASFNENAAEDEFMKDALEGLESFSSTQKIHKNVRELNRKLHQSTGNKKKIKPFEFNQIFWYVIAVVVVIILILLAFAVFWSL